MDIEELPVVSCAGSAGSAALRGALLAWYDENRRKLPWRGDAVDASSASSISAVVSPYGTWVSEVMLQQTKVATVISHYIKWMERFPNVAVLAAATEDDVAALWSGLGYYRRASLLLKGARYVVEKHGGSVPLTVAELKLVPGIGDYTAGAIASIAHGLRAPVVDGNVVRVFSRLQRWTDGAKSPALARKCWRLAGQLVADEARPGAFNQALMELGATVCTPRVPACGTCPLRAAGVCASISEAESLWRQGGMRALQELATDSAEGSVMTAPQVPQDAGCSSASKRGKKGATADTAAGAVANTQISPLAVKSSASEKAASGAAAAAATPGAAAAVADIAAMASYIQARYPGKTEKKAVPVLQIVAIVAVDDMTGGAAAAHSVTSLSLDREAAAAAHSTTAPAAEARDCGPGLHVWLRKNGVAEDYAHRAVVPSSAVSPSCGATVVDEEEAGATILIGEEKDDAGHPVTAGASSSAANAKVGRAKPSALLQNQWQPLVLPMASVSASREPGNVGAKRKRGAPSSLASMAAQKGTSAEPAGFDEISRERILDVCGAHGLWPPSPLAAAGAAAAPPRVTFCGVVHHAFSHVMHHIHVVRVDCDGRGGFAAAAATPSAAVAAVGGCGSWQPLARLPGMGLTTWAAKMLHVALQRELAAHPAAGGKHPAAPARAGRAGKAGSSAPMPQASAPRLSNSVEDPHAPVAPRFAILADAVALELLRQRWRTAGGKVVA